MPKEIPSPLARYRQRLLKETEAVVLDGIPLPVGRQGELLMPRIPLERLAIRLQLTEQREWPVLDRAWEAKLYKERGMPDSLPMLAMLGEHLYRRGMVYQGSERPPPLEPEKALATHRRLVVLGAPGAGKSTLLRYLAYRAAEHAEGRLAILVSLRHFAHQPDCHTPGALRRFALAHAAGGDAGVYAALEEAAAARQVLWLADALDEAGDCRDDAAREIARLPGTVVLTSRPLGYVRVDSAVHFEILPLTPTDIDTFLRQWFSALGWPAAEVQEHIAWIHGQMMERRELQPLLRNPLLLTFLAVLASDAPRRKLPETRGELYRLYLERLYTGRGLPVDEAVLNAACFLGWAMHAGCYGGKDAKADLTCDGLARRLAQYQHTSQPGPDQVEQQIDGWRQAGLLQSCSCNGKEYLAFRHRTFAEYGAAWGLRQAWLRDRNATWAFLRPRLHHYAWREPLLLLAGMLTTEEAGQLIRHVYRARSPYEKVLHRDLRLAALLLKEQPAVKDAAIEQDLHRLLLQLIENHRVDEFEIFEFATPVLLARLEDQDWQARLYAVEMLGQSADPAIVPALLARLDDREARVRSLAAWAVGRFTDPSIVPTLLSRLEDEEASVRESAAEALLHSGDPTAVPALRTLLGKKKWLVRGHAAQALIQPGEPTAVPTLLARLGEDDPWVRAHTAEALGQSGDPTAVPALLARLEDEDSSVRAAAAAALGEFADPATAPALLARLADEEASVRANAAQALGQAGDQTAVPALLARLEDQEARVRCLAAWALGRFADTSAVPALLARLADEEASVRASAARSLGQLADTTAVPALLARLTDEDSWVRTYAAWALGQAGDTAAVPALLARLEERNAWVREAAAAALGQLHDPAAVPALLARLEDQASWVRESAVQALCGFDAATVTRALLAVRKKPHRPMVNLLMFHLISSLHDSTLIRRLRNTLVIEELTTVNDAAANALSATAVRDLPWTDLLLRSFQKSPEP